MVEPSSRQRGLPWTPERGENARFGWILLMFFLLCLPVAVVIPLVDVPDIDRSEQEKVPPRLAKLVEQRRPPEPVAVPEPEPEPISEPEPVQEPEPQPEPAPSDESLATAPTPESQQAPAQPRQQSVEQARETASRSGLLAMKDQLATLRQSEPARGKVRQANVDAEVVSQQEEPADTLRGSGGVATEKGPTRDVEVERHQVREVAVAPDPEPRNTQSATPSRPAERGMSNIRHVFDAQKTALYSIYRRELRQDPTLEGQVLLELVIEPDGTVSSCEVVSSELDHPELERRIATRVRLFNFGSADVATRKVKFPIDFLPG